MALHHRRIQFQVTSLQPRLLRLLVLLLLVPVLALLLSLQLPQVMLLTLLRMIA